MPSSSDLHSKLRPRTNTIRKVKVQHERMKIGLTSNPIISDKKTVSTSKPVLLDQKAGLEGSTSNPVLLNQKTGLEGSTSNPVLPDQKSGSISNPVISDKKTGLEGLTSIPDERTTGTEEQKPTMWIQFGPTYGEDTEVAQIANAKDSAWQHIMKSSGGDVTTYLKSISKIEKKAMEIYDSTIVDQLKRAPSEFRWMMVRDGCFFLQLALHVLGAGEHLNHPLEHPYFGKKIDSSSWIPAMFFPGNQIPNAVINALMKQAFFEDVIRKGEWQRPTENLAKLVLYQTVVEPHLAVRVNLLKRFQRKPVPEPPTNILHALHNFLLGPGYDNPISDLREFQDLEDSKESNIKFPSAGELKKSGVLLKKADTGITNICFKNCGYRAFLCVPPLMIDSHTEQLLTSLVNLERGLYESDRDLTAYIRFMRDLVPTYKDFKILENKGIIQVKDEKLKSTLIPMLKRVGSLHNSRFTLNFRKIHIKTTDYGGPPWLLISFFVGCITVTQTIITIIAYVRPRT